MFRAITKGCGSPELRANSCYAAEAGKLDQADVQAEPEEDERVLKAEKR